MSIGIPVPICRYCGGAGVISDVESYGAHKEWIHDRDPKVWGHSRRYCISYIARLTLSEAQWKIAKKYTFELLTPDIIARSTLDDGPNEVPTWLAKSWEAK